MKKLIIFALFLSLLISISLFNSSAQALDVTAESGSAADIQVAVDQVAAAGGGNVYIPAGTFHWNGDTVTIPGGVNVFGASPAGCKGHEDNWEEYTATTILHNDVKPTSTSRPPAMFRLEGANGKRIRISGIQFEATPPYDPSGETTSARTSPAIMGFECKDFRIDHCTFINFCCNNVYISASTLWWQSGGPSSYGIVDHCVFDAPYKDLPLPDDYTGPMESWWGGYGVVSIGNMANNTRIELGARLYAGKYQSIPDVAIVYTEDCHFSRLRHGIDSNSGGVPVTRYCLFDNPVLSNGANIGEIDSHGGGWQPPPNVESPTLLAEVYENTITGKANFATQAIRIRGGSGIFWNNHFHPPDTGNPSYVQSLVHFDSDNYYPEFQVKETYIWGNDYSNCNFIWNGANRVLDVDYFLRAPSQAQDGWTYTPYPYPHPLTLENYSTVKLSGRLLTKSGSPMDAKVIVIQQGTVKAINNTINGYYSLSVPSGIYDIQFNFTSIPNYYIKLNSVNLSSDRTNILNYINYSSQRVSFIIDFNNTQRIETYSSSNPKTVLKNGSIIENVLSLANLKNNSWFYEDSSKKKLHILVNDVSNVVIAKSGYAADIQSAVDQVLAAGGGTVYIPEGDWQVDQQPVTGTTVRRGGAIFINLQTLPEGAWLNIIGSYRNVTVDTNYGQTIVAPATILRSKSVATNSEIATFVIIGSDWDYNNRNFIKSTNRHIRISGLTILGTANESGSNNNAIRLQFVDGFRIDHVYLDSSAGTDISAGYSKGVIDHSTIDQTYHLVNGGSWGYGISIIGNSGLWASGFGNATWIMDLTPIIGKYDWQGIPLQVSNPQLLDSWTYNSGTGPPGNWTAYQASIATTLSISFTAGPVYIEDNILMHTRHAIAGNGYGYYVARHNTFSNPNNPSMHLIDLHGVGFPSMRGAEIYENTVIGSPSSYGIAPRGGGGVIFNNTIINTTAAIIITNDWWNDSYADNPEYSRDWWIWGNNYIGVSYPIGVWLNAGVTQPGIQYFTDVQVFDYSGGVNTPPRTWIPNTPTKPSPPRSGYTPYPYPHPLTLE